MEIVLVDGRRGHERLGAGVLRHCMEIMPAGFFERALLFCPDAPDNLGLAEWRAIPAFDLDGYCKFLIENLFSVTSAEHVLVVQGDGFVIHPELWDDDWLRWDYIGSPWPDGLIARHWQGRNVGNGGFSLRSRRLLELCSTWSHEPGMAEDVEICQQKREDVERAGLRFAPVEVAGRFSVEWVPVGWPTFGFHGTMNHAGFTLDSETPTTAYGSRHETRSSMNTNPKLFVLSFLTGVAHVQRATPGENRNQAIAKLKAEVIDNVGDLDEHETQQLEVVLANLIGGDASAPGAESRNAGVSQVQKDSEAKANREASKDTHADEKKHAHKK